MLLDIIGQLLEIGVKGPMVGYCLSPLNPSLLKRDQPPPPDFPEVNLLVSLKHFL